MVTILHEIQEFLWCLFRIRGNYPVSSNLNVLIYRCIWLLDTCPNVSVEIDYFHIRISTSSTKIELWNANKFYAWLSSGCVNGRSYDKVGASARACYEFKECLKRHGYNIYVKRPDTDDGIRVDDVKC